MPTSIAVGAALLVLSMVPSQAQVQARTEGAAAPATARVIVKFKADSPLMRRQAHSVTTEHMNRALALGARVGLEMRSGAGLSEHMQVLLARGITSEQLATRLSAESDIAYAVPDERRRRHSVPNDPLYLAGPAVAATTGGPAAGQWYLRAPDGEVQSSLDVEPAWSITTGSAGIVVAVIDTGVRFDHPDLLPVAFGGNLLPGYDMIGDVDAANDGDGRDDDASDPGDWLTLTEVREEGGPFYLCNIVAEDSSWHGTQVGGLIGALTNNGRGMASVGRSVRILPVRALGKCGGHDSDIIAGMRWAAGLSVPGVPANPHPARVLNLSLGGEGACTAPYADAVAEVNAVNAVVVASAGNGTGHAVGLPANCPGVIAVAGLRHVGSKVGFSNLGPEVAISAPGGNCVNTAAGTPCLYPILTTANAGLTVPIPSASGGAIYTDSFNTSIGTSFSAPLVAGTVALMLSTQPALTAGDVRALLRATARPFPTSGGDNGDGTPVPQCTVPRPIGAAQVDQLQCYCTTATCGAGMLDAGAAVRAAQVGAVANYTGLFWNAPGGSEAGWGINFAHQGDVVFATWFTYDITGKAWWLSMTANKSGEGVYSGSIYETHGPAFDAVPFSPAGVTMTPVGSGTLTFGDRDNGSFAYRVNSVVQAKAITRQAFAAMPTCVYGAGTDPSRATNYQGLWYAAPAESEAGWGTNFTHQGDTIFATWFTYDVDGTPLWLSATAAKAGEGMYTGTLYRTTGPAFNSVPFVPANVARAPVGTLTLAFTDGNRAIFTYTVALRGPASTVTQSKAITRQVFRTPGTVCH